ncbi:hypothetical protein MWN41_07065 [Ornithobacterium rhinotracheale]|uniref:hypothetical protein n=1 Tax=Ornithobacterium rhinotracheale TaxID=28251 RepID=UPI001FF32D84|nr:hypothetical protein [Ornithobacterium rhinotracheale]MCK0202778.1 hypothetical protein [Ornithobacterium rhinotracheale]
MAKTDLNTIKNWFKNGLKPTQEQFWAWLDSFWHKDDKIPAENVEGLDDILSSIDLSSKLENADFERYKKEQVEAFKLKADANASNLDGENKRIWKSALGINEKASSDDLQALKLEVKKKANAEELQVATTKLVLIDELLKVDDDTLDELKEIVNYIKQNRSHLESLSVSNIAGLDTALEGKLRTTDFQDFKQENTEELEKKANTNADNIRISEWKAALGIIDTATGNNF